MPTQLQACSGVPPWLQAWLRYPSLKERTWDQRPEVPPVNRQTPVKILSSSSFGCRRNNNIIRCLYVFLQKYRRILEWGKNCDNEITMWLIQVTVWERESRRNPRGYMNASRELCKLHNVSTLLLKKFKYFNKYITEFITKQNFVTQFLKLLFKLYWYKHSNPFMNNLIKQFKSSPFLCLPYLLWKMKTIFFITVRVRAIQNGNS